MKRILSILLALALVLAFSLVMAVPALAVVLPVHNVTQDLYYATIQAAIDAANPGDTINVAAGTYTEYLHITTDGLTIQGAGIDQSIIDLDGLTPYWHYPGASYSSRGGVLLSGYGSSGEIVENIIFRGFTVKNAGLNPPTPYTEFIDNGYGQDGVRGIMVGNGKNILIQNCKVQNSGDCGISVGKARGTTLTQSEGVTIYNCIVVDNWETGISVGDYIGAINITNNTCSNNKIPYTVGGREYSGKGIEVGGKSASQSISGLIFNNICSNNGFEGIVLKNYADGVTIESNLVTGHNIDDDGAGIFFYGKSSNPANCKNNIIKNNTVTGNIRGIVAYYAQACTIEGNTITTDSGSFPEGQGAMKIDNANSIVVRDNTVSCDGTGITVSSYDSASNSYGNTFTGNTITGAKFAGVLIYGPYARDNTFTCNTITGTTSLTLWGGTAWEETQADGVFLDDDAGTGNVFHGNSIYGNAGDGMENQITATVDAENNWWGCNGGPGAAGCDTVVGNVDYTPWASASSVTTATGTGTASFAAPCGSISGLTAIPEGSLPTTGKPNLAFPHGFFSFDITGLTPGQMVTVTITLPTGAAPTQYWKYHPNTQGGWVQIPMTVVSPNVIRITLVDGGLGDDDGLANGVIVDQGAPASGAVGWETYPISKVRVFLPWIALLAAVMAGASLLVLRRRRAQS